MTFPPRTRSSSRAGFTIIELLIVIGIIVTLASIGVVVGKKAFGFAAKTRLRAQLQTIERALEAYKTDFGSFPITDAITVNNVSDEINREGLRGARTLCKALVAPTPGRHRLNLATNPQYPSYEDQDGKVGPGFRIVGRSGMPRYKGGPPEDDELQGKEYGPYIAGNAITFSKTNDNGTLDADKLYDDTCVLLDANGYVILYYPVLNSQPAMNQPNAYVGPGPFGPAPADARYPLPMYRFTDNSAWYIDTYPAAVNMGFHVLLGDVTSAGRTLPPDGAINNNINDRETAVVKNQPLLISPGRDGIFGPNPNDKNKANDDVTNFGD